MELEFPTDPKINDTWKDPSNNVVYKWDGYRWTVTFVNVSSLPRLP
jgi:hypothetical protein